MQLPILAGRLPGLIAFFRTTFSRVYRILQGSNAGLAARQIHHLFGKFSGQIKAWAVVIVLFLSLLPQSSYPSLRWLLFVPLILLVWYLAKLSCGFIIPDLYYNTTTQRLIGALEAFILTGLLLYLAVYNHSVPLSLTLLYALPLFRFAIHDPKHRSRIALPCVAVLVLLLQFLALHPDYFEALRRSAINAVWMGVLFLLMQAAYRDPSEAEVDATLWRPLQLPYGPCLERVAQDAVVLTGADIAILWPWDGVRPSGPAIIRCRDGVYLNDPSYLGKSATLFRIGPNDPTLAVVKRFLRSGRRTYHHDVQREDHLRVNDHGDPSFVVREGIVSSVGVPLPVEQRVVGVLWLNYRRRVPFDPEYRRMINTIALAAASELLDAEKRSDLEHAAQGLILDHLHARPLQDIDRAASVLKMIRERLSASLDIGGSPDTVTSLRMSLHDLDKSRALLQRSLSYFGVIIESRRIRKLSITNLKDYLTEDYQAQSEYQTEPPPHLEFVGWNEGIHLLPDDAQAASDLYLILAEALCNSAQWSKATSIVISLAKEKDGTVITVSDNGIGFDRVRLRHRRGSDRMEKLAKGRGWTLTVETFCQPDPRHGTTVRCAIGACLE